MWVASYVFKGLRFADKSALVIAALMLGFVNALLRPILIVLTLPLTLLTLGLFLLVLNALLLMLVAKLIRGFSISGFWTAFFASIFITVFNLLIGALFFGGTLAWQSPVPVETAPRWI
jgi:putative membrane protein